MARLSVDIQLEILVVVKETAAAFEDGEMRVITLRQHVDVVSVGQLRLHLDDLPSHLGLADGVDVRPVP